MPSYLSIEKSFHDFRQLVAAFKKAAKDANDKARKNNNRDGKGHHSGWKGVPESTQNLIAFTECFAHVIEGEPISTFVGKVSMVHLFLFFKEERSKVVIKDEEKLSNPHIYSCINFLPRSFSLVFS